MIQLNFPKYDFRIHVINNQRYIYCVIRQKFYILSPEEWVRQHVINFLIREKGYEPIGIVVEAHLSVLSLRKRLDIIVHKQAIPYILVECKTPNRKLSKKVFDQIQIYYLALQSPYLMITNGLIHLFGYIDPQKKDLIFLKDIPSKDT